MRILSVSFALTYQRKQGLPWQYTRQNESYTYRQVQLHGGLGLPPHQQAVSGKQRS